MFASRLLVLVCQTNPSINVRAAKKSLGTILLIQIGVK